MSKLFTFGLTTQRKGASNSNQQLLSAILGKIDTEDRAKLDDAAKKIAEYMDNALGGCSQMKNKLKSCAEKVSLLDEFGAQTYELVETQLQLLSSYNLFFETLKGVLQKYNVQELLNTDTQLNQLKYLTADAMNKFVGKVDVMKDIYAKHGLKKQSDDLTSLHETLKKFGSIDKAAMQKKQQEDKKTFEVQYKNKDILPEIKLDPESANLTEEDKQEIEEEQKRGSIYINGDIASGDQVLTFVSQASKTQQGAFDNGEGIREAAEKNFGNSLIDPTQLISEEELVQGSKDLVNTEKAPIMNSIVNNSRKFQAPNTTVQQKQNNVRKNTKLQANNTIKTQKKNILNAIESKPNAITDTQALKKLLQNYSNTTNSKKGQDILQQATKMAQTNSPQRVSQNNSKKNNNKMNNLNNNAK